MMLSICSAQAEPLLFQNSKELSSKNIDIFLQRFVKYPHPMGSPASYKLAQDIHASLSQFGLKASLQEFESSVPEVGAEDLKKKKIKITKGYNIVAHINGQNNCAVILSGHYDTKYFPDQFFVGANDGGSSTALLWELARVVKHTHFKKNSLGSCSLYFVFFDGEEAILPNWDEGEYRLNIQDNLYGSRAFAKNNLKLKNSHTYIDNKEIFLLLVLDMVGHKQQNLYITAGSQLDYMHKFIHLQKDILVMESPIYMKDDHSSFVEYNIPFLHIIDWTNLQEWHTFHDNLNIISSENIKKLGENILRFLSQVKIKKE